LLPLDLLRERKIRNSIIFFFGIVFLFVSYTIITRTDNFSITKLGIKGSNRSVYVSSDSVRAFNGAYFYKIDLATDTPPVVLSSGVKLPVITKALWVDDIGVVLNFDQSITNTAVESVATSNDLSFTEKRTSTWYFDFKTSSLSYIGNYLIDGDASYVDNTKISFMSREDDTYQFHTFNTETKKDSIQSIEVKISDIDVISRCIKVDSICITGPKIGDTRSTETYAIGSSEKLSKQTGFDGTIYPLARSGIYAGLSNDNEVPGDDDGLLREYNAIDIVNTITKKQRIINISTTLDGFLYTMYNDQVVVLNNDPNFYTVTKNVLFFNKVSNKKLRYSDGSDFTDGIIFKTSTSNNLINFISTDGAYNILAANGYLKNRLFSTEGSGLSIDSVTECVAANDVKIKNTDDGVTVLVLDDDKFKQRVKSVSLCIAKDSGSTYALDYSFVSISPVNGRPTSY